MDQKVSLNQLEYKLTEVVKMNGGIMEQEEREFGGFCREALFSSSQFGYSPGRFC